jgi:hypothetical protein
MLMQAPDAIIATAFGIGIVVPALVVVCLADGVRHRQHRHCLSINPSPSSTSPLSFDDCYFHRLTPRNR